MSSDVRFSINGDTNAEQVSGRAKAAVSSLDKQLDAIGNKFKGAFKDIFLSFLGPMALLGAAMNYIGKLIEENQRKQEAANQAAIDGTNKLMSAEDRYWANKRNNEKKDKEDVEQAKTERIRVTEEFLSSGDERAKELMKREAEKLSEFMPGGSVTPWGLARDPRVQAEVQRLIAEDAKKNPIKMQGKDGAFSAPSGFSNVIGVGSNPVLENLTRQTDIQQAILDFIRTPAAQTGASDIDFTKQNPNIKDVS